MKRTLILIEVLAVVLVALCRLSQLPVKLPERAHFYLPAHVSVLWVDHDYEMSPYQVYHVAPVSGQAEGIGIRADSRHYISKRNMPYVKVMLMPGENANIRRRSDNQIVAAVRNDSGPPIATETNAAPQRRGVLLFAQLSSG